MIYTFYSFKGGVGRSMALANVAESLRNLGVDVLIVDWDLEAPGLENYFEYHNNVIMERPGVIDLLEDYKYNMAQPTDHSNIQPVENLLPNIRDYIIDLYPNQTKTNGSISLLHAGKRLGKEYESYAEQTNAFDWTGFYEKWNGEVFFEWLRTEFNQYAQVTLIDSRTGITEMGGVCTYQLADAVILFCAGNQQNIEGTYQIARNITRPEITEARQGREIDILVVPSRIEDRFELDHYDGFREKFEKKFKEFSSSSIPNGFWSLRIPYIPYFAFTELVAIRDYPEKSEDLTIAYDRLTNQLLSFSNELSNYIEQDRDFESNVLLSYGHSEKATDQRNQNYRFDVFLSYNNSDKAFVVEIASRLEAKGIKPFLDMWHLVPGESRHDGVDAALDTSRTCVVFLGPNGMGDWGNEEMRIALDKRLDNRDFRIIPVLLPNVAFPNSNQLPKFLKQLQWVEFKSVNDESALHRLKSGIYGRSPGSSVVSSEVKVINPYQGLRYFDQEHVAYFAGRGSFVEQLISSLKENDIDSRFLTVIGSSGGGKSSVIRAGLLPEIRRGVLEQSQDWRILVMTPTSFPLRELAVQLSVVLYENDVERERSRKIQILEEGFLIDERLLNLEVKQAFIGESPNQRLLIFVDQFEELFTLCNNENERIAFFNILLYAASIALGQCIIIVSIRAEFYAQVFAYQNLANNIIDKQLILTPMTKEEVREAIVLPAQSSGVVYEDGLVNQIIQDFVDEPGGLPLLQGTLYELWSKRDNATLTHSAYQEIGGVKGAIGTQAEIVFQALTKEEQQVAKRIFLKLVQPGEDSEDTCRQVKISEFYTVNLNQETIENVIYKLINGRLVTSSVDITTNIAQLDVAHEVMIKVWPRLRQWIDEDRESLKLHRRLGKQTKEWLENDKDIAYLYRGGLLNITKEWLLCRNFFYHVVR